MAKIDVLKRSLYSKLFVIVILLIIMSRLAYIQLVDDSYKRYSRRNTLREVVSYPPRGEIFDRNGVMIAKNNEAYNVMVVPRETREFDTLKLANIIGVPLSLIREKFVKARKYSSFKASVLVAQIPQREKLILEELNIPGLSFVPSSVRSYNYNSVGNIFGYMGEVSQEDIDADDYYVAGDFKGKTGIEKVYEPYLRGVKGASYRMVDVHGVERDSYDDGADDVMPIKGSNVISTLDINLQELGLRLMKGKIGAVVAIEPSTGEVLAMVSSPTYNLDSLVGINMGKKYMELLNDPYRPLFNRAVMGGYSPGSTFKMANALLVLQDKIATPYDRYECNMGWSVPGRTVKCHSHRSPVDMFYAIQTSCNAYFCSTFRRLLKNPKYDGVKAGLDAWSNNIKSFGFGVTFDTDIPSVTSGLIPNAAFYNRMYNNYWNDVTIISLSIGQGEITASPLQIANFTALIANRGFYHVPHIVREVEGESLPELQRYATERHYSAVDKQYFDPIVEAMWKGMNVEGTGTSSSELIRDLNMCGKSGTAQNSRGEDHSTYVAFAPKDNPKIAVAVYVEHGGWGNNFGLPIATLMIEHYLRGEIQRTDLLERMETTSIEYKNYRQ